MDRVPANDLKPCPFCGKKESVVIQRKPIPDCQFFGDKFEFYGTEPLEYRWRVYCRKVDIGGCAASTGLFATKLEAIKAWNRRQINDAR